MRSPPRHGILGGAIHPGGFPLRAPPDTEREILAVLERFNERVGARDLQGSMALFAQDADVLLLGSESGEIAAGRGDVLRFFTRIFSRPVRYSWAWSRRTVSVHGEVAWLLADGEVRVTGVEGEKRGPYRMTAVLVRHEGRWLVHQFHGSEPARS